MSGGKGYVRIDIFRLIAAVFVIAIHTSPLLSLSESADFILTRVIARVAVPFFFMTSGFFTVSRYNENNEKILKFVKNTLLIYAAAIVFYIPLNIYSGSFLTGDTLRDILWSGTVYHLWYLPAAATGGAIAYCLIKKFNYKSALFISGILYAIGLFGDSWYGIGAAIPAVKALYDLIFRAVGQTRNGVFFAPLFFVMGSRLGDKKSEIKGRESLYLSGFAACMGLMIAEGIILNRLGAQRHDSMYAFLPGCMYFLFRFMIAKTGRRLRLLRTASLCVYILHPAVIIAVRFAAKITKTQRIFIDNSAAHFLAVSVISVILGFAAAVIEMKIKKTKTGRGHETERAWVEINLNNLNHNLNEIGKILPGGCELMAVVKADAYGHGAFKISTNLEKAGVKAFAAATVDEGIILRKFGISGEILVLGYSTAERVRDIRRFRLIQTVVSYEHAAELNRKNAGIKIHIKIDTGMHRLGVPFDRQKEIEGIFGMKNLRVCGIFSHLCCADGLENEDREFTEIQIKRFNEVIKKLREDGFEPGKIHLQSSFGALNYPGLRFDYARVGIALYGVLSERRDTVLKPDLRPVLSLKARVEEIIEIKKGETAGYGRAFRADRDGRLAILSIGYADGYPRELSCGRGMAKIGGYAAPIAGRVCMDRVAVDVTGAEGVAVGDEAVLIEADRGSEISAEAVAERAGTIANELLSRLGGRPGACAAD